MRIANITRLGFGLLYLLGALFNTFLAASYPQGYLEVTNSALLPVYKDLWRVVVAPNLPVLLVLLILFEFSIGVLILSKGIGVKLGLLGGLLFNLFLVPLQFVGEFRTCCWPPYKPTCLPKNTVRRPWNYSGVGRDEPHVSTKSPAWHERGSGLYAAGGGLLLLTVGPLYMGISVDCANFALKNVDISQIMCYNEQWILKDSSGDFSCL